MKELFYLYGYNNLLLLYVYIDLFYRYLKQGSKQSYRFVHMLFYMYLNQPTCQSEASPSFVHMLFYRYLKPQNIHNIDFNE